LRTIHLCFLFLGGLIFGIFGKVTNKYGRWIIVLLGYLVQMGAFAAIFVNMPDVSPLDPKDIPSYVKDPDSTYIKSR